MTLKATRIACDHVDLLNIAERNEDATTYGNHNSYGNE
jgi:hypothetical protein